MENMTWPAENMSSGRYMAYSPSPSAPHSPHLAGIRSAAAAASSAMAEQEKYLQELLAERHKLSPFVPVLPYCYRLLNQEILRVTTLSGNNASILDQSGIKLASPMASGGIYSNGRANMNRWGSPSPFQSERDHVRSSDPHTYKSRDAVPRVANHGNFLRLHFFQRDHVRSSDPHTYKSWDAVPRVANHGNFLRLHFFQRDHLRSSDPHTYESRDAISGLMQSSSTQNFLGSQGSPSSGLIVKKAIRVDIPIDQYPNFNFVGRLLGPRGNSLKRVEASTDCRVLIRGRGSIKDQIKEEMMRGKPGYEHLNEPLHIVVEAELPVDIVDARLMQAREILEDLLKPVDESQDFFKKQQLRELAMLNGTLREESPQMSGSVSPFNDSLGMKRAKTRG